MKINKLILTFCCCLYVGFILFFLGGCLFVLFTVSIWNKYLSTAEQLLSLSAAEQLHIAVGAF